MKTVEKMQLNMVIFEVVDSGDLFGAVITKNVNAWTIPIKFANGEIVILKVLRHYSSDTK